MKNNKPKGHTDDLNFEETPIRQRPKINIKRSNKPIRGMWSVDPCRPDPKWRSFLTVTTSSIKSFFAKCIDNINHMRYTLYQNISERISNMSKTTKNTEKSLSIKNNNPSFDWKKFGNGIMGIGQLFVSGSIIASTFIIVNGTEGISTRIIVAPMAVYAVCILVSKFASNNQGNK